SLLYEKPKSCSNNGFLPLSEIGFVLYKGQTPDTGSTKWFKDDYNNATNIWDLNNHPDEGDGINGFTYYQRFSWELNCLMMSMAGPLIHRRFIYNLPLNDNELLSLFKFCVQFDLMAELYTETYSEASRIRDKYNAFIEGIKK